MSKTIKFLSYFSFICFFSVSSKLSAQAVKDPIKYSDYIVQQQTLIGDEIKVLNTIISDVNSTEKVAMDQISVIKNVIIKAIENLDKLEQIEPDFNFKANASTLFKFYKRIVETTYVSLISELYSESPDNQKLSDFIKKITDEETNFDKAYLSAQEEFATYYNFSLE